MRVIRKWVAQSTAQGAGQAKVTTGEQRQTDMTWLDGAGKKETLAPGALLRSVASDLSADEETVPGQEAFDVTTMLQLSLFLMLLTFFLALSANTTFDQSRVGPVIGGIQSAFGVLRSGQADDAHEANGAALPLLQTGAQPASGAYAAEIEDVFSSVGRQRPAAGSVSFDMLVRPSLLFVDGAAAVRADQRALFRELGPLLLKNGDRRHLAVLVPASPAQRLDVRRAASLARLLLADGAPPEQIAVGVRDTTEPFITFRFYILPGSEE
ncbi:hypothetical protein JYT24_00910 [Parvibaculum lavamentivorans]|nr:hypothetical protein [Parvibaculum lavamentivorans]